MKLILIIATACFMVACDHSEEKTDNANVKIASFDETSPNQEIDKITSSTSSLKNSTATITTETINRKIIWRGSIEMQVKNVEEATSHISEMVEKNSGFISDMQTVNDPYRKSNTITIRMVRSKFQSTINSVKKEASYLKSANINSEDVTEEYVDIESRLKTKRDVRDRYIQVLRTKAGSVKDIIEAEEAIRQITEEIEVQEGRMHYLNDKIDLSTIEVEIFQTVKHREEPITYEETYGSKVANGFGVGWHAIQGFILGLITIWPLLIVIGAVLYWKRTSIRLLFKKTI